MTSGHGVHDERTRHAWRADTPRIPGGHTVHWGWAVVVGLLGVLVAVVLPFAPVIGQASVVQWPQAGQPPRPTTAFFVPYRPAELHVAIPCGVLRATLAGPGTVRVLSTGSGGGGDGLVIESSGGRLRVATDGQLVPFPLAPLPLAANGCELRIDADRTATTVSVSGAVVARLPGARVPEVFAFDTDLDASAATGMAVTARTPYWFASTPTGWKYGLIAAQVVLAATALVLLARRGRRSPRVRATRSSRGRWVRGGVDALVLVTLAGWGVIGPLTDDDGFAAMIARNAGAAGDTGNYYRWFNASEAPFALAQQLVRAFAEVSITPLWLRVPSLLAGALTWLVLHRWVLPLALPRANRTWANRTRTHQASATRTRLLAPVAAVCFLAWWLPYGLGTRPEPFVALGSTLVLALVLAATSRAVRRPLLTLGLATLIVAATAAVAPTGLLAAVPVVLSIPGIWRLVSEGASRGEIAARVALLGAVAATVITLMFADQSWHGVSVATDIHRYFGPDRPWFKEDERYTALLGPATMGSAGKRLPVLLTLALVAPLLVLLARHGRALLERRPQLVLLGSAPLGLLLLTLTPSKWTHHFGALAGLGSAFLVAALAVLVNAARPPNRVPASRNSVSRIPVSRDPVTVAVGVGAALLVAIAAGLSFAGPNTWWAYSDFGMPFSDAPLWPLHNPLLWLAVAGGAVTVVRLRRSGSARVALSGVATPRVAPYWVVAPALLAVLAATTSVALLLGTFLAAPLRRGADYSLPAQNLAGIGGTSCGIEDHVQVLQYPPDGALEPAEGADTLDGAFVRDGYPTSMDPPPSFLSSSALFVWGSAAGDLLGTGSLRTAWFTLPVLPEGQELAVSVAGRLDGADVGGGNTVVLEFGRRAPGGAVEPLGTHLLRDPEPIERAYADNDRQRRLELQHDRERAPESWRTRSVRPGAVPSGADRVRVLAVDGSVGEHSWLAVTGPRRLSVTGLRDFLDARGPVLLDWPISFAMPCRADLPTVAGGLAEAPAAILAVPQRPPLLREAWTNDAAELTYSTSAAASFAGVRRVGRVVTVETRLAGDEGNSWGRVQLVDYGMARDAYDTHPVHRWQPGWSGDDTHRFD
ncbi:MAG: arabinosyltransferase domain-containing protein [Pseudonocardiales bacterium]